MRLFNFTIIKLTICLIIGILIGYYCALTVLTILSGLAFLIALLFVLLWITKKQFQQTIWFGSLTFVTFIFLGMLTNSIHDQRNFKNHYSHILQMEGDSIPEITFRIREVLKSGQFYDKYVIDILNFNGQKSKGLSLLNVKKENSGKPLKVDDVLMSKVAFKTLLPPLNPHQFDYKAYLEKRNIYHQLFAERKQLLKTATQGSTLFGFAEKLRDKTGNKLSQHNFSSDELAIVKALLLGQRQDISEEVYQNYTNAGAIHILAISGLHIGIILIILSFILKPVEHIKHGWLLKTLFLVIVLWLFAIVAGLSASVTRAVTMFSIVTIALSMKRPTNIYNTISISILIILLVKPLFIFDVGFQLSYAAVLGIVGIDPYLYKLWSTPYWILDKYWHTLTVTIAAQVGIIPLSLFYFHQFPTLFFISNLVIIPFLGIILGLGIFVILLAVLSLLPNFLVHIFGNTIDMMNSFVAWIANKHSFLIQDIPFAVWQVIASYILIITFFRWILKKNGKRLKGVLISIIILQGSFIYCAISQPNREFVIFHKSRHTLLGDLTNHILYVNETPHDEHISDNIIKNYALGNHIDQIQYDTIKPVYLMHNKTLLVIDSLGIYNLNLKPDYILLIESPKINLNRLIDSLQPKHIVADGSNYKSYKVYWRAICDKRKIPFHDTSEKGALLIPY